ncbi:hypothetical protein WJX73_008598 [Symbiochloris irregularis]|uniref:beta-aspartyl-peptidase n=1 Tax=Symbiochloris irregularis TaxID=706552 RepID=A0AAW1PDR2_9CHLO
MRSRAALISLLCYLLVCQQRTAAHSLPIVVNTWPFTNATRNAWERLQAGGSSLDAVQEGCTCELEQCDFTVGYGGSPDELGKTTLDALIMDGSTMRAGAVANLQKVKKAISTARLVLEHTTHTLLSGQQADAFAAEMGEELSDLSTPGSTTQHQTWLNASCQPNFRRGVVPDPTTACGPYHLDQADPRGDTLCQASTIDEHNHDTISMVVVDETGKVAAGSSSNGATHKVPGRVGDAAVPGGGAYASPDGGCASTGDGDTHLRFQPCLLVVEAMRGGASPLDAAQSVVKRMAHWFPQYVGALVAVNARGQHAAAAFGWQFQYAVRAAQQADVKIIDVEPLTLAQQES